MKLAGIMIQIVGSMLLAVQLIINHAGRLLTAIDTILIQMDMRSPTGKCYHIGKLENSVISILNLGQGIRWNVHYTNQIMMEHKGQEHFKWEN